MLSQIKVSAYSKSYQTRERAEKAAVTIIGRLQMAGGLPDRFVMSVTDDGRYSPIIISRNANMVAYAHSGFTITN